ncbi:MAG: hypothetical protein H7301_11640 [Cryobacterium sp.]|nr:hypothetical protein [Oligoflexia bacterium]
MSDAAVKSARGERIRFTIRTVRTEMKENGLRGLFRRYGWRLFAFGIAYYLIRDIILYLFIPWLIARHLINH